MKQIVIISGKGGTGKTVISAAFASLAKNKVMVDCDVDAANLHLLMGGVVKESYEFKSGQTAVIDKKLCQKCGKCLVCRFKAIKPGFEVEKFSCEGCGLCARICPYQAVTIKENTAGSWFISDTNYGPFVHAKLGIAEENSGKLVTQVRKAAAELAQKQELDYVIIDGPPGIGCPVIASLSGVDAALVVTEPTLCGLHDAKRAIETAKHFNVGVKLAVNKYDLNPAMTEKIELFCRQNSIPVAGRVPFDKSVVEAMIQGKTVLECGKSPVKNEVVKIWEEIKEL